MNNDMDDLFRRAAEDYPLHTKGADWSKVMQGLEAGTMQDTPQKSSRHPNYFWVAAIFFIVICTTFIQKKEAVSPKIPSADVAYTDRYPRDKRIIIKDKPEISVIHEQEHPVGSQKISVVHKKKPQDDFTRTVKSKGPFLIPPTEDHQLQQTTKNKETEQSNTVLIPGERQDQDTGRDPDKEKDSATLITQEKAKPSIADMLKVSAATKRPRKAEDNVHRFYAGITGGPDLSTIKSQKTSNAGYSVGLIAGYQFSRRFSAETGISWDKKDYYTVGKHFDKTALGLPAHAKVIDVDGYCKMFEIPVNLKYNWVQKRDYHLFATTGISSYLMKKESYDYAYDYYGTQYKYYKDYNNASRNWMSIINMSIGYERRFGNAGFFRIEPYLKLPLKGVGVGKMPVSSKGVLVGFIRPIK